MVTQSFFALCVKKGIKGEGVDSIPDGVDFKKLYNYCIVHSLGVAVYRALLGVKGQLPDEFTKALEYSVKRFVRADVQSEHDANNLFNLFEENQIKYMPLKGWWIKRLYPTTDMRYSSDVDVLVENAQMEKALNLALSLGFEIRREDEHHNIIINPSTKRVIELHKSIFVGKLNEYFGAFERAYPDKQGGYLYRLSVEDFYATMIAHSAYHFASDAGVGLRHVADIYLYKKAHEINYEYLDKQLEECNLLLFKNNFERLADYFFEDKQGDEFTIELAKHVISSTLLSNEQMKSASMVASNLKEGESKKKTKNRTLFRIIFPKVRDMQYTYPVLKKGVILLPIFYVVRWFQVIFTRPKNLKKLSNVNSVKQAEVEKMQKIREGLGIQNLK